MECSSTLIGRAKTLVLPWVLALWAIATGPALAQTPPVPDTGLPPTSSTTPPADLPGSDVPVAGPTAPGPTAPAPGVGREAELEGRIRQLERMVEQMSRQMGAMNGSTAASPGPGPGAGAGSNTGGNASVGSGTTPGINANGAGAGSDVGAGAASPTGTGTPNVGGNPNAVGNGAPSNTIPSGAGPGGNASNATPSQSGGPLAPGQSSPPNPAPSARFEMPATTINAPLTARFGPGFELKTADDEFVIQFHNLTQFDGRFYEQGGQNPVRDTFAIPRQWWMLSGRITKPFEYFLSFQEGFDNLNLLDVFLNIHYDDRLQFKLGRYKTPFTYEFYTEPIQGLIQPERSLFFNNFGLNRSLGMMAWGRLFNTSAPLDYAVGIFNNARNSLLDTSDSKNVLAYLNWRPFAQLTDSPIENFVFGGSVMAGTQTNPPVPSTLRTVVPTSGNSTIGVPWLTWNANVRESGPRAFWDLHAAYYYRHLSLISEWQSGYQDYALVSSIAQHNRVGVQSFYVQGGYFITGETVSGRGVVKPLRNFDIRKGKFGPGAIELTSRFNALNLSNNVFRAGLADQNLWTNNLYTVDTGFNWSFNQYVKFYFDWNHAVFGNPVQYNGADRQKTADLFLFRFQLYF